MEQITKLEGAIYYGEERCRDINDAYSRFRRDYHDSIGRCAWLRLNRLGQRTERIHGYGFVFEKEQSGNGSWIKATTRLMGLVCGSYCRILGCWDIPYEGSEFDDWFDWVFSKGSKAVRLVGTNEKAGRTSRRLKTRYR